MLGIVVLSVILSISKEDFHIWDTISLLCFISAKLIYKFACAEVKFVIRNLIIVKIAYDCCVFRLVIVA